MIIKRTKRKHGLTDRQLLCLCTIYALSRSRRTSPTLRELGEQLGISSGNGCEGHIKALIANGYLIRYAHIARGMILTRDGIKLVHEHPELLPVIAAADAPEPGGGGVAAHELDQEETNPSTREGTH